MDAVPAALKKSPWFLREVIEGLSKERDNLIREADRAKGETKRHLDDLRLARESHASRDKALQDAIAGISTAEAKTAGLQNEVYSLRTAIQMVESEREAAESELSSFKYKAANLSHGIEPCSESQKPALEAEIAALRLTVEELESDIAQGMRKNRMAIKMFEEAQTRADNILTNNDIINLQRCLRESEQENQRLRTENKNIKDDNQDLKRKLNGTSFQADFRMEEKTALENQYKALDSRMQSALSTNSNLHRRLQDTEAQLRNIQERYDHASNEIQDFKAQVSGSCWQAHQRLEKQTTLETQNRALESRARQAEAELAEARSELRLLRGERGRHNCVTLEAAERIDAGHAELFYRSFHPVSRKEMEEVFRDPFEWHAKSMPKIETGTGMDHHWGLPDGYGGC